MSNFKHRLFFIAAAWALAIFTGVFPSLMHAKAPPDQAQLVQKKESMAVETKKNSIMKEEVSKAANKREKKTGEMMKKENKK